MPRTSNLSINGSARRCLSVVVLSAARAFAADSKINKENYYKYEIFSSVKV
jgi:hypothetical protein